VGCYLFIVPEALFLGSLICALREKIMRQDCIRLLADLISVKVQGMVMKKKGKLFLWGCLKVPYGLLQERIILWVDPQLFIIGKVDIIGSLLYIRELFVG
jgi:hypothetical protein